MFYDLKIMILMSYYLSNKSFIWLFYFCLVNIIIMMIIFIKGFLYARHYAKPFTYHISDHIKCIIILI